MYRIEGKWSEQLALTNVKTDESEVLWRKNPYPENYQYMHGMTGFML